MFIFGKLQTVPISRLASLPPAFISDKPYANYYGLALIALPPEEDDKTEAAKVFAQDALNRNLLLNVEYKYDLNCTTNHWTSCLIIFHLQSEWSTICNADRCIKC